jgi:hypothetical protein
MQFDGDDAKAIAKKLGATLEKGRKHDIAVIKYSGKVITQFGIRRGSGNLGHDYIPGQIHVTNRQAKLLRQCPMSFEDWIAVLKEKHIITEVELPAASFKAVSEKPKSV